MSFFKNKVVVVTGGSGFIGSHYIEALVNQNAIVRTHTHIRPLQVKLNNIDVYENIDLTKYPTLDSLLKKKFFDLEIL